MLQWDIAYAPTDRNAKMDNRGNIKELLAKGWEPFGVVSSNGYQGSYIILRKQITKDELQFKED